MKQSWLLQYLLFTVVAAKEALADNHAAGPGMEKPYSVLGQDPLHSESALQKAVISEFVRRGSGLGILPNRVANPTDITVEGEVSALQIPEPTISPSFKKRQDDSQAQALSAQLQSLSQSATKAISSISSSASSVLSQISQSADQATQSMRRSAEQAVQSASQVADQANRQLSQTQSSASSAVSAANARASDQVSQSLASMSSRMSANQASIQKSASDAVSSARLVASQFAASQIQAFQMQASGMRSNADASSPMKTAQPNSLSIPKAAIIITVSIIGTAILSASFCYLILRYRRKKRSSRDEAPGNEKNEKTDGNPIASRASLSPRFPRFGRGSTPLTRDFKLASLSPFLQSKKFKRGAENSIRSAISEYSDGEKSGHAKKIEGDAINGHGGVGDEQPSTFRLQKNNGVSSATAVRLIRVGSKKAKTSSPTDDQQTATGSIVPPVANTSNRSQDSAPVPISNQSTIQSNLSTNEVMSQPPKAKSLLPGGRRGTRPSTESSGTATIGLRRPARLTAIDPNRFRFRDSSDSESGGPVFADTTPSPRINQPSQPATNTQVLANRDLNVTVSSSRHKTTVVHLLPSPGLRRRNNRKLD
ncbi:hypothetical protein F4777DRAFT_460097 [Nemania sp. FL0916]|nr:hypothetical protein F4777DRAFT_460097 [Nemania sp. FL0916]